MRLFTHTAVLVSFVELAKLVISRSSPNPSARYVDTSPSGNPPHDFGAYAKSKWSKLMLYRMSIYRMRLTTTTDVFDTTEIVNVRWRRPRGEKRFGCWNTHPIGRIYIRFRSPQNTVLLWVSIRSLCNGDRSTTAVVVKRDTVSTPTQNKIKISVTSVRCGKLATRALA